MDGDSCVSECTLGSFLNLEGTVCIEDCSVQNADPNGDGSTR